MGAWDKQLHSEHMSKVTDSFEWSLFVELRKEVVESQKIRAQIIGFKITFVSVILAGYLSDKLKAPSAILLIPSFAAILFDLLINSYSFSIKRIGTYLRTHIEPRLKQLFEWPSDKPMWEEYLAGSDAADTTARGTALRDMFSLHSSRRQGFSFWGNIGFTFLTVIAGVLGVCFSWNDFSNAAARFLLIASALCLLFLFALDVKSFITHWRMGETNSPVTNGSSPSVQS